MLLRPPNDDMTVCGSSPCRQARECGGCSCSWAPSPWGGLHLESAGQEKPVWYFRWNRVEAARNKPIH